MKRGSVADCLQKSGHVPSRKRVTWEIEAYDDDCADYISQPICAAGFPCPDLMLSVEFTENSVLPFEAMADAQWVAGCCLVDEVEANLKYFQTCSVQCSSNDGQAMDHVDSSLDSLQMMTVRDRAHIDSMPQYHSRLYPIFQQHSEVVDLDDGPILSVCTWFIDGERFRICRNPRILHLDQWFRNWDDDLRRLWRNVILPDLPIEVHVVRPTPPPHPRYSHDVHLIVTQQEPMRDRAILRAEVYDGPHAVGIVLSAAFLPRINTYPELIDGFGLVPHCSVRACTFVSDSTLLHSLSTGNMILSHGDCVLAQLDSFEPISDDDISLMQTIPNQKRLADESDVGRLTKHSITTNSHIRSHSHGHHGGPPAFDRQEQRLPGTRTPGNTDTDDEPTAPEYLSDLQGEMWRFHRRDDTPEGAPYVVRFWYIHHERMQRCSRSKVVRISEHYMNPWPRWHEFFMNQWADEMDPDADVCVTSVAPRPSVASDVERIDADIIISQGLDIQRYAVLITAKLDPVTHVKAAFSVEPCMSGNDFRTITDLTEQCQPDNCVIRYSRQVINLDDHRTFQTNDGQGINIDISEVSRPRLPVASPAAEAQNAFVRDRTSDVQHERDNMQKVFVYNLRLPWKHIWVEWTTFHDIAQGVANAYDVLVDSIQDMYEITAQLPGEDEHETSFIMCRHGDIDLGSHEQLILLDVEKHVRHVMGNPPQAPNIERSIVKTGPLMARQHIIAIAQATHFCQLSGHRCLVYCNNENWPSHDLRLRNMKHGDYLKVILPPPDPDWCDHTIEDIRLIYNEGRSASVEQSTDQMMLLQTNSILTDLPLTNIPIRSTEHCSTVDDEDNDRFPFPSEEIPIVPPQPPIGTMPEWIQQLWPEFLASQQAPGFQDNPQIQIQTWYLSHQTSLRCEYGRAVQLGPNYEEWQDEIVERWDDLVDRSSAYSIAIVQPKPLQAGRREFVAHVMLTQHQDNEALFADRRVEIVATTIFEHDTHPRLWQIAVVMPAFCMADELFYVLRIHNLCLHRRAMGYKCTIQHGANILEMGLRDLFHPADSAVIHLPDAPSRPTTSMNLLQIHVKRLSVQDSSLEAVDASASHSKHSQALSEPLSLADKIQPPSWTQVDISRVFFLRNCLKDFSFPWGSVDRNKVDWKECTKEYLDQMPIWHGSTPLKLCFYTDGSANGNRSQAASAVFLIIMTANGCEFGGFHSFKPVQSTTAQAAEHCAIFGAVVWALNIVALTDCRPNVAFYFDCFAAGYSAAGWWNSLSSPVAPVTRALVLWLEEIVGACHWQHTAAHSHIPGNEAADQISKQAWIEDSHTCEIDTIWKLCTFDEQCPWVCEWLWFLERQLLCPTATPMLIGQTLWYNVRAPLESDPDPALQAFSQHVPKETSERVNWFQIQVATANVLSLFPADQSSGNYISARAESLLRQFDECQIDVIGFQETRSKAFGHSQQGAFHILSAPANSKGQFGVQLCIRSTIQGPHGDLDIAPQHLRILAHDPRYLIVQFQHGDMQVLFIVAHAPCEDASDAADRFWHSVNQHIPHHCHGWTTVALIDANARLGNLISSHVGDHQADTQNHNGQVLHNWLSHNDLYLPQTFDTCHCGSAPTWTHPTGSSARLDFIALSKDIDRLTTKSWVDDRIDLSIVRADHLCVCAQFWIQGKPCSSRRPVHYDSQVLPSSQPLTWSTNVHDHAAILQTDILAANPRQTIPRSRKPHLQESTWELIRNKKWHHKQAKHATRSWRLGILREIFGAWKDNHSSCPSSAKWQKECLFSIEWHHSQSRLYALQAKKACRQDDIAFYERLAQNTADAIHGFMKRQPKFGTQSDPCCPKLARNVHLTSGVLDPQLRSDVNTSQILKQESFNHFHGLCKHAIHANSSKQMKLLCRFHSAIYLPGQPLRAFAATSKLAKPVVLTKLLQKFGNSKELTLPSQSVSF